MVTPEDASAGVAKYISPFGDSEDQPVIPDARGRMRSAAANKIMGRISHRQRQRVQQPQQEKEQQRPPSPADPYSLSLPNTPDTEDTFRRQRSGRRSGKREAPPASASETAKKLSAERPAIRLATGIGGESYI